MAWTFIARAQTGITHPFFIRRRRSDGAWWNTSGTPAFEAYNASHIANYGIAATELSSTGLYSASDPSPGTEGDYDFISAAGSSLAVSDLPATAGLLWQDDVPAGAGSTFPATVGDATLANQTTIINDLNSLGSGTGARTVTITVNDGTNPLQAALVRVTLNSISQVLPTNSSGQITFNLNDGTWTVAIYLAGYTFGGASLVVSGTTTHTYSMSQQSITPSAPGFTTGYSTTYTSAGIAEPSVPVTGVAIRGDGLTGSSIDTAARTVTSDGSGLAQFTGLILGATYGFRRGAGPLKVVTIPLSAGSTYALPDFFGTP